jgi:hypothetical protein
MSLTPPPLRSGSVPATGSTTAGMGGAQPQRSRSPHTPQQERVSRIVCPIRVGR